MSKINDETDCSNVPGYLRPKLAVIIDNDNNAIGDSRQYARPKKEKADISGVSCWFFHNLNIAKKTEKIKNPSLSRGFIFQIIRVLSVSIIPERIPLFAMPISLQEAP